MITLPTSVEYEEVDFAAHCVILASEHGSYAAALAAPRPTPGIPYIINDLHAPIPRPHPGQRQVLALPASVYGRGRYL